MNPGGGGCSKLRLCHSSLGDRARLHLKKKKKKRKEKSFKLEVSLIIGDFGGSHFNRVVKVKARWQKGTY